MKKKTGCLGYVRHEILTSRVGLLSWLNLHHFKLLGLISSQLQAGDLSLSTEEMRLRLLPFFVTAKKPTPSSTVDIKNGAIIDMCCLFLNV